MPERGGVDIATLGLRVDATELDDASAKLRSFQAEGARTEQTTQRLGRASIGTGASVATLNSRLANIAITSGGVNVTLARMVQTFGTLALGGVATVGVLGGLAAISAAYRRLTRDAREARESAREHLAALRELQDARLNTERFERLSAARGEVSRLEGLIAGIDDAGGGTRGLARGGASNARENRRAQLVAELSEARGLLTIAEREITEARVSETERREAEIARIERDAIAARLAVFRSGEAARRRQATLEALGNQFFQRSGQSFADIRALDPQVMLELLNRREQELEAGRQNAARTEIQLTQERALAHDALVRALENVGRAYGGVADQVLALAAATLSLSRLPGFSDSGITPGATTADIARGLGTSALQGVGIGATTGNPALGALGGGAAGFATAGPPGAIVGAVSGIITGLFEQGRRAAEAARTWRRAFEDFENMFVELSPREQTIQDITRRYEDLAASLLDTLGPGTVEEVTKQLAALEKAYVNNLNAAKEMAKAEKDLADTRFSVLNAPQGFNAAYYGFLSGGLFDAGSSSSGGGGQPIVVVVELDGEVIARSVENTNRRQATLGGPGPLATRSR